jgi:HPt (histidine-containing phosphotransfer) domain-containing protein
MSTTALQPEATRELLSRLWQRSVPLVRERLATLDAASAAAHTGKFPDDLRIRAIDEAHKLAGSLGMFGYPESSALATEIEALLEAPDPPPAEFLTTLTTALRTTLFPPT